MNYKTHKGRKGSFMRNTFITGWINHKKEIKKKKVRGCPFVNEVHPLARYFLFIRKCSIVNYLVRLKLNGEMQKLFQTISVEIAISYLLATF